MQDTLRDCTDPNKDLRGHYGVFVIDNPVMPIVQTAAKAVVAPLKKP